LEFGEAPVAMFPSPRRIEMTKRRKMAAHPPEVPTPRHQMMIAFESLGLHGLSLPDREKTVTHLSNLLLLAAGAPMEDDNER
jgi:hypothetical protein